MDTFTSPPAPVVKYHIVNFVSAKSIENYIQDSMEPFMALAYFTSSQAQDLKSLTFAAHSTVLDQATNKVQEIIEIQDEDPILMLEKAKNFAKEFLGIIENQKRKLSEEYELDLQAYTKEKIYSRRFSVYRKHVSTKQAEKLEKDL
ncbi:hypothetical protein BDF20DRAFT_839533 [Mycotypha africana]|uniref:uncharacterized protein n=1 Tax=Mycotypha africana TaxID=64632 RepID=UPI002301AF98|nr:uncharacterized protein BDF20DRAFT_839533 [Mycotypha africana]KAI8968427.1 hypothetical protein BDF20DRAFT_839533 [Mycotypha africana]